MSDLEQTASDILTGWNDRLVGLADALTEAAKAHGPDVADLVLAAARVEAASDLVLGFVLLGVCAATWRIWWRPLVWSFGRYDDDSTIFPSMSGFILLIFATIAGGIGAVHLADLWSWVGVIEPKLCLAHKLLDL